MTTRRSCGGAQLGEGTAPGDDLVEDGGDGAFLVGGRAELAEVLEVGEQRESDLVADIGDLEFAHHQSQVLDGSGATDAAVADEAGGLVVPLLVEEVDGVLQGAGGGVVVLGSDEDVAVEGGDLLGPGLGVGLGVLAERGGCDLVEVGELEVGDVDELVLGVRTLLGDVVDPLGDGFAVACVVVDRRSDEQRPPQPCRPGRARPLRQLGVRGERVEAVEATGPHVQLRLTPGLPDA